LEVGGEEADVAPAAKLIVAGHEEDAIGEVRLISREHGIYTYLRKITRSPQ